VALRTDKVKQLREEVGLRTERVKRQREEVTLASAKVRFVLLVLGLPASVFAGVAGALKLLGCL
jgi:hypothetical protein